MAQGEIPRDRRPGMGSDPVPGGISFSGSQGLYDHKEETPEKDKASTAVRAGEPPAPRSRTRSDVRAKSCISWFGTIHEYAPETSGIPVCGSGGPGIAEKGPDPQ